MCGTILRPFNSISDISCRWEGGIEMCVIAPVYSMEDCRLQLIPRTAKLNLLSYPNSNSFQTWPCRYNYVHVIQCDYTHNLMPLLLSITSQLGIRNWLLVISSWFLVIMNWLLIITSWLLNTTSWFHVITSWLLVITSWLLVITSWLPLI